jgi:hypothetical protein
VRGAVSNDRPYRDLIDPNFGEQTAQAGEVAVIVNRVLSRHGGTLPPDLWSASIESL